MFSVPTVAHAEITPVQALDGTTRGVIGIAERFVVAALFDGRDMGQDSARRHTTCTPRAIWFRLSGTRLRSA